MTDKTLTLLILFSTLTKISDAQAVTYSQCDKDNLSLTFFYSNPAKDPYDLFAISRRSTCGKRAGSITGNGTYAEPYVIAVDLSGGLTSQSPECGVVQIGQGRYRLTVRAIFSCEDVTPDDTDYTAECDLPLPDPPSNTAVTSRLASYTCQAPSTIVFTYSQSSLVPPFDIYAADKEVTCSLSASQGTGTGADADPYVLQIDVSDTTNDCGVTKTGTDTYSVVMYVQQLADLITSADVSYALTCNFTSLASQVISSATLPAQSNIPVGEADQNQPSASLYVVSSSQTTSSASDAVLSSFAVGDSVRLAARLLAGPATGLRVRQCTASPGPDLTPQISVLNDKGCSTANSLVPPFIGQSPSGEEALTDSFEAFKFTGHATVYFQCVADFCYGVNDQTCQGSHCLTTRRKREANNVSNDTFLSDVITAYVTVHSDVASNITRSIEKGREQEVNSHRWTRNYIAVVASLAAFGAALVLVCICLCVAIIALQRRVRRCRETHAVPPRVKCSAVHGQRSFQGERQIRY
ncbi:uncharacterized protein [Littorina saxatilis]|uniref:ZP domain-containing protein n=1 Tax=Littorina saxatilis TaxID=31220 RepID=A0AAN9GLB0_9CAEN